MTARRRPRGAAAAADDLETRVRGRYATLSAAHRRVADLLLSDGRRAALAPAGELAKALGLSEATVVRVAGALGYAGYPELRRHLRERFLTHATSLDRLAATAAGGARRHALARVLSDDADAIVGTLAQIPPATFDEVVRELLAARRVYIVGARGSAGIALMLGMGLRLLLPETRVLAINVGDTAEELLALGRRDVVVVISYLRYSEQTLEILRYARDAGARTVAITDSPVSPVAQRAGHALITRTTAPRLMASYTPAASVAGALVEAVAARLGTRARRSLRQAETLWTRFRVHAADAP